MKVWNVSFSLIFSSLSCTPIEISNGVIYEHIVKKNLSIHKAQIDPTKASIILDAAHGKCKSSEKVTEMAKRHNAILAINGSFFDFGQKNKIMDYWIKILDWLGYDSSHTFPVFCLKIKDKWFSSSNKNAGIIGWNQEQVMCFDTTEMTWFLQIDEKLYPIADINKPYAQGPILYNEAYDDISQKKKNVTEIVVQDGKIKDIIKGKGGTKIPLNGFIYAIESKDLSQIDLANFEIGKSVLLVKKYSNATYKWEDIDYLLGSTPLLIKNGQITQTVLSSKSSFFTKFHPRTAVGVLEDGNWIFIVVDGRQKHSRGMTLLELAQYMKDLGCKYAINLDGGGSSVMVVKNKVVNLPSGREYSFVRKERFISNAIMVIPKQIG